MQGQEEGTQGQEEGTQELVGRYARAGGLAGPAANIDLARLELCWEPNRTRAFSCEPLFISSASCHIFLHRLVDTDALCPSPEPCYSTNVVWNGLALVSLGHARLML